MLIDWATSAISMGRAQQLARERKPLPPGVAVDASGEATTDAGAVSGLLPFGGHKGYGLGLINELVAGMIGGYLPTVRGRPSARGEKNTCCFQFLAIHPEAISAGDYFGGRTMDQNLQMILDNILKGNERAHIPGANAAKWRKRSQEAGGLIFTEPEIEAFNGLAVEGGVEVLERPYRPCTKFETA